MSADDNTVCNESQKSSTIPSRPTIVNQPIQQTQPPQPKVHEKAHFIAHNGTTPKNALGMLQLQSMFVCIMYSFLYIPDVLTLLVTIYNHDHIDWSSHIAY